LKTPEFIEALERMGRNPRPRDEGWISRCPGPRHKNDDRHPSLHITEGTEGILVACGVGCTWDEILESMGLPRNSLFYDAGLSWGAAAPPQPEGMWAYHDEEGAFLFHVLKYRSPDGSKWFKQRHYDPESADADHTGWVWNIKGVRRVLYKLPELVYGVVGQQSNRYYIVDGEKDADCHRSWGRIATCGPGGANKWLPGYVKFFVGKSVCIVKDKDPAGDKWAEEVADSLEPGRITTDLKIVEAVEGKDSYDTLTAFAGNYKEAFRVIE
jgi:hypothetical protein